MPVRRGAALPILQAILPPGDRYIDLAIATERDADRFGGFIDLLDRYDIGAFAWNGREDGAAAADWQKLVNQLQAKRVPVATLGAGDRIKIGTVGSGVEGEIDILSPDGGFLTSADPKEASLVTLVQAGDATRGGFRTLLMGAATAAVEADLLSRQGTEDIRAEVLTAASHGAAHATTAAFLRTVRPAAVVIAAETGSVYRPAPETLARIASSTAARVFRTDTDGTLSLWMDGGMLKIGTAAAQK